MKYAPDLIVGYRRGFRASWSTVLGDLSDTLVSNNTSAWCADHCMDSSVLPGVLFSSQPIAAPQPKLIDLAPSVLTAYGLDVPESMEGRNIFKT